MSEKEDMLFEEGLEVVLGNLAEAGLLVKNYDHERVLKVATAADYVSQWINSSNGELSAAFAKWYSENK
jgi:hypothetical protein